MVGCDEGDEWITFTPCNCGRTDAAGVARYWAAAARAKDVATRGAPYESLARIGAGRRLKTAECEHTAGNTEVREVRHVHVNEIKLRDLGVAQRIIGNAQAHLTAASVFSEEVGCGVDRRGGAYDVRIAIALESVSRDHDAAAARKRLGCS